MPRFALAAALLLAAPAALAQVVTEPVVTVSAGLMQTASETVSSAPGGGSVGYAGRTFYTATLGGEVPVYRLYALVTGSVGATIRAASALFGNDIAPQSVTVYARAGFPEASALLGVSLDVGNGLFESGRASGINSDGQTAVLAQVRASRPAGRSRLFGQFDGAFALPSREEILITTPGGVEASAYQVRVRTGSQASIQLGAAVPAGPIEVALALSIAGRTEGSYRFSDGLPPPAETGGTPLAFSRDNRFRLGYSRTVGLIPSVTYQTPDERLTLRVDGSFTGYAAMEDTPLGVTLSSKDGPRVRPAITVSASVGL